MLRIMLLASLLAAGPLHVDSTAHRPNRDSVAAIATVLRLQGGDVTLADRVAAAIDKYAARFGVAPMLVAAVIGVENRELAARSRSIRGAQGIMQVMPGWRRDIKSCGRNLRDVDTNVCMGTKILSINLHQSRSLHEALLRYNGCVRARGCRRYPSIVLRKKAKAESLLAALISLAAPKTAIDTEVAWNGATSK